MALRLVEGPPGSGKTYYAVRRIDDAIAAGKVVVTNVQLSDDWADRIARGSAFARFWPRGRRKRAARYAGQLLVIEDLDELFRVRVDGDREGRWVVVLDEAHTWLNSRTWSASDRLGIVRWFSRHRHYGADAYVIAQDVEMLDKQVRTLFEERVTLRNLRNFKLAGIRVVPGNFFVAIHRWNSTEKHILKRDTYKLSRRVARLYNTHQLAAELAAEDGADVIRLPLRQAPRESVAGT